MSSTESGWLREESHSRCTAQGTTENREILLRNSTTHSPPSEKDLADAIEEAAGRAIAALFSEHPSEHFYYCALITSGEAHSPTLTAWSTEALDRELQQSKSPEEARWWLEWSYGESPYFCSGQEHFERVNRLFSERPPIDARRMSEAEIESEFQLRIRSMETAMSTLDSRGLFGSGPRRLEIVVNVEVMPPDFGNTERALRLNPLAAIEKWLKEVAEPSPGR